MIVRDELWLERAFDHATHRVALPSSDRWLPRRRSSAQGEVGLRRLVLAGVVLAGLVAALLYAVQLSARLAPKPSGVLNPSSAPHLFTAVDADRIILQFNEPPSGMRGIETASGHVILTNPFGGSECAGMALPDTNFVSGELMHFREQAGDPAYRFLASWAVVYSDSQSASDALRAFERCFQLTYLTGQDPVDPKLGAEGFVLTGAPGQAPDFQAAVYMWRVDNLLLHVMLNGVPSVDWRDAEEVARIMNARATARAK